MTNLQNKDNIIKIFGVMIIILIVIILIITFGNKESILTSNIQTVKSEAQQMELVDYEHTNFKMKIPKGWTVDTAGDGMYFSLRVFDPNDNRYQIFAILKAEPILKNNQAKQWYENYYKSFGGAGNKLLAEAIVVPNVDVELFYKNFNNYVSYARRIGSTFKAPNLNNFNTVEVFENNSALKSFAKDDKIVRGTFQDSLTTKTGEGLFMATIIDQGVSKPLGYDVLYYTAYNVMGISTAEYELINYQDVLVKSLTSLEYKESFVKTTINNIEATTKSTLDLNRQLNDAYDSYNNAWTARQKSYDVTSQKRSDATLGYERVYNSETGEIYKAYNGFIEDNHDSKYQKVTDDMYSQSINGYIEKRELTK